MKKYLLLMLLIITSLCHGNVLTGTLKDGNGNGINGRLILKLSKTVSNHCSTSLIVPLRPVTIQLVNGVITNSPDIVPSFCITPVIPTDIEIYANGVTEPLFTGQWYIGCCSELINPSLGNSWVYPSGVTQVFTKATYGADYETFNVVIPVVPAGSFFQQTVTWPKKFTDTNYTYMCSSGNPNLLTITYVSQSMNGLVIKVNNGQGFSQQAYVFCVAHEN